MAYQDTPHQTIEPLAATAARRAAQGEHRTVILQDMVEGFGLGWQSANHHLLDAAITRAETAATRPGPDCTCHLKENQCGPVPHCCPAHDGDYMSFLALHNCD